MEKAKTVSRSVIQQRTVEQIVSSPAAKVVELVPQMIVQLVDVPQTVSRGRSQRVDEQIVDRIFRSVAVLKTRFFLCLGVSARRESES